MLQQLQLRRFQLISHLLRHLNMCIRNELRREGKKKTRKCYI